MRYIILFTILLLDIHFPVVAVPPTMHLSNSDNHDEPMSNYIGKGQWVVANVWSPDCSACIIELPRIKRFISRNPDIPVIGITLDFPSFGYGKRDVLQQFLKTNSLDYPLFLADINQASELTGRWLVGIPLITIFHPDGRPLVRWPGIVEIEEIEKFIENYQESEINVLTYDFE